MRRFLFGAGCYLAGIMTLPLLSVGVWVLSASSVRVDAYDAASDGPEYRYIASVETPAECVTLPAAGNCPHSPAATLALTDSVAQVDVKAAEDPFGQPAAPRTRPSLTEDDAEFAAPAAAPVVQPAAPPFSGLHVVMPIVPAILPADAPQDEAEVAKTKELRETLKKVVEEKAEMLNTQGLEIEIKLHQMHLVELKSLKELLALQRSLQELRDKFPDSDAGRRASELLNLLEQQHHRGVGPTPRRSIPSDAFEPIRNRNTFEDAPINPQGT